LEASQQFSFLQGRVSAPRSTPILEDQASVLFISPRGRVAQLYSRAPGTHFSRLLRHAWVGTDIRLWLRHMLVQYLKIDNDLLSALHHLIPTSHSMSRNTCSWKIVIKFNRSEILLQKWVWR
jgi:hypothetical protein